MKKFGFTLAEVLITLGIIGVIAALTTPALVKNSGSAKIGPSLAKFVNTFETGVEQMMYKENLSYITIDDINKSLSKYIVMSTFGEDSTYKYTDALGQTEHTISIKKWKDINDICKDGGVNNPKFPGEATCDYSDMVLENGSIIKAQLKDGSVMVLSGVNDTTNDIKAPYKGIIAVLLLDIDGDKTINKAGKDVFGFLVDKTGVLVPMGSNTQKNSVKFNGYSVLLDDEQINTGHNCNINTNSLSQNLACTGKYADNAWKSD